MRLHKCKRCIHTPLLPQRQCLNWVQHVRTPVGSHGLMGTPLRFHVLCVTHRAGSQEFGYQNDVAQLKNVVNCITKQANSRTPWLRLYSCNLVTLVTRLCCKQMQRMFSSLEIYLVTQTKVLNMMLNACLSCSSFSYKPSTLAGSSCCQCLPSRSFPCPQALMKWWVKS